jgi:hypothetical protein
MGWLTYHTRYSLKSVKGFPDVCLVRPPRCVFAELKRDAAALRETAPEQQAWLDALGRCTGVEARLWTPDDWPEIQELLR